MVTSGYSIPPRAPWQAVPSETSAPPSCWHFYVGDPAPGVMHARLSLYWDGYCQRWTWEVSLTNPGLGLGYKYGYSRTWAGGERAALAALAELLHPAEQASFL